MFLAGAGANLKGAAPILSAPIKFTINTIKMVVFDSALENGHLYDPIKVINYLDTSIYVINSVINDNQNIIEEVDLKMIRANHWLSLAMN